MRNTPLRFITTIVVLVFIWLGWVLLGSNATIDIHFHDTYYIIGRRIFALFLLLLLLFLFSFFAAIAKRFNNHTMNWILFLSTSGIIVALAVYLRPLFAN